MLLNNLLDGATPQLVMFDLDGTLIDSAPDLFFCVNDMLQKLNKPLASESDVRLWVGNGVKQLLHRALTNQMEGRVSEEALAQALPIFFETYEQHYAKLSVVYAGVIETLQALQKFEIKMACVTNKAAQFTLPILKTLQIEQYFNAVVSGDTCQQLKPHPEPLYHAVKLCNVDIAQSVLVGDSVNDVQAARNAGMKVVAVTYGYNHGQDIRDSNPDAVINSLLELVK